MKKTREISIVAILSAVAVMLGYFESMIPTPVAGVKLGIGNVSVLVALYALGTGCGLIVCVIKVLLCGLLFGNFSAMLFSICGAALSLAVMIICKRIKCFSVIGVSALGALAHNFGQLGCAYFAVGKGALVYMPVLCASAAVAGALTGVVAHIILKRGRSVFGKK